jgi:hypothetical protein
LASKRWCASSTTNRCGRLCELGRRADDVPRAGLERGHQDAPLLLADRPVRAQDAQAERPQAALHRVVLIVRERAQRIDDERLAAARKGAHRRRILIAERLAAPGPHHGDRALPALDALEDLALRFAHLRGADQRAAHLVPVGRARPGLDPRGDGLGLAKDADVDAQAARAAARHGRHFCPVADALVEFRRQAARHVLVEVPDLQRPALHGDRVGIVDVLRVAHERERIAGAQPGQDILAPFERDAGDLRVERARLADRRVAVVLGVLGGLAKELVEERVARTRGHGVR